MTPDDFQSFALELARLNDLDIETALALLAEAGDSALVDDDGMVEILLPDENTPRRVLWPTN